MPANQRALAQVFAWDGEDSEDSCSLLLREHSQPIINNAAR